jgi:predicted Zn-dependent protease
LSSAKVDEIARAFAPPSGGSHVGEPTTEQLEAVYDTACRLCDEDNFRFASALVLHLVAYKPGEPRFSFLAGTCMQRQGMPSTAARFFCAALVSGGDHSASLFRLGECMLVLGDTANADRAFDAALDVSRGSPGAEELQHEAQRLMDSIRPGSQGST